ncbi:hypothetical protein ASC75_00035 [Aminobacter sp. DSM 101952]|uniref:hypothetical protein n=1 Tax=unclassified Aminobacter TaxID=2644704 RepID=UPI0006F5A695|nr:MULTISPECIES: hypothetical protein [unclassified Aminobacter]AWC23632.1 hypothetical protein CO731_03104 [Aminobacter sp. MSH1]KQU76068.1 hypothetical protein ASC75_00035 [Aminobacter sp. DSM 101952]
MTRRLVIDSNMMRSQVLRDFLSETGANIAVLPDVIWVETYKSGTLRAIAETLSVVGDFPDQVIVLKSSGEIAVLDPAFGMTAATMGTGNDLREMMKALDLARRGEATVLEQFTMQWSRAADLMGGMLEGAVDILQSLPEMEETYTAEELRRFRTTNRFSQEMIAKIFGSADQVCETLFALHGREPPVDIRQRSDTYLYRFSLAIMMYMVWWIRAGSQLPTRHDRARNDIVDLSFAVHATYFDDLMTQDKKAVWMYTQLSGALRAIHSVV